MLFQRTLKIVWLAPAASLAVGLLDLSVGEQALGVGNLVASVAGVFTIKWLETDGKIDFSSHPRAHGAITPQDREFREIHEYL